MLEAAGTSLYSYHFLLHVHIPMLLTGSTCAPYTETPPEAVGYPHPTATLTESLRHVFTHERQRAIPYTLPTQTRQLKLRATLSQQRLQQRPFQYTHIHTNTRDEVHAKTLHLVATEAALHAILRPPIALTSTLSISLSQFQLHYPSLSLSPKALSGPQHIDTLQKGNMNRKSIYLHRSTSRKIGSMQELLLPYCSPRDTHISHIPMIIISSFRGLSFSYPYLHLSIEFPGKLHAHSLFFSLYDSKLDAFNFHLRLSQQYGNFKL